MEPELTADLRDASCRSMKERCEYETDFVFVEATFYGLGWSGCVDAERLQHVGAAATRGCRPRAMFRYGQTGTDNHKSRGCSNIKGFCSARSSARRVDKPRVTGSQWE